MYKIMNVPHAKNDRAQLTASVDGQTVHIRVVDPKGEPPYNSCGVGDMFIGDHMFEPDKRDALRMMVGEALIRAIDAARAVGYRQAQTDIRAALGILY